MTEKLLLEECKYGITVDLCCMHTYMSAYLYVVTSNQARSMDVTGDQARSMHVTKVLEKKTTVQACSRRGYLSLAWGFGSSLVCLMNSKLHL